MVIKGSSLQIFDASIDLAETDVDIDSETDVTYYDLRAVISEIKIDKETPHLVSHIYSK